MVYCKLMVQPLPHLVTMSMAVIPMVMALVVESLVIGNKYISLLRAVQPQY